MKRNVYNCLYTALYGGTLGDALCVPYEFCKRGSVTAQDMSGYGTYNLPSGTWQYDTSLTLCLIKNLIQGGDASTLLDRFLLWFEKGKYTPYGVMFDIGTATQNALLRYKGGTPPHLCGGAEVGENGNGALMRIAPLAFMLYTTEEFLQRAEMVKQYSEITHRHPRSVLACIMYIELLIEMLTGTPLEEALKKACGLCRTNLVGSIYEQEFPHYARVFDGIIKTADRDTIQSGGYVVDTLEAALWSCLNSTSLTEAILTAVNLGEDTDTVGAVAGTIASMHYKNPQEISEGWLKK